MKRFQNIVATSRITLPVTCIYGIIIGLCTGLLTQDLWMQGVCIAIATALMIVLNNSNSLIRVYSRLVSCTFLVLALAVDMLHTSISGCISTMFFISMIILLFRTYQDRNCAGTVFYAFVCMGIISTQFIQVLFLIPFIWILLFTSLQAQSVRNIFASILGIILPYWFWIPYELWQENMLDIITHFESIIQFEPLFEGLFSLHMLINMIVVIILGIGTILHFLQVSYNDNIKTRMFYNVLMVIYLLCLMFSILQPQHSTFLMPFLIVTASPFIAHYFTFTHTWLTNASFYFGLVVAIALTVFNTWM